MLFDSPQAQATPGFEIPADLRETVNEFNNCASAIPSLETFTSIVNRVRLLPGLDPTWATSLFDKRVLDSINWQLQRQAKGKKAPVYAELAKDAGEPAQFHADFGDIGHKQSIKIRALIQAGHSYARIAAAWRQALIDVKPGRKGRESRKYPGRVLAAVQANLSPDQAEQHSVAPTAVAAAPNSLDEHRSRSSPSSAPEQTLADKRSSTPNASHSILSPAQTSISNPTQSNRSSTPEIEKPRNAIACHINEPGDTEHLLLWPDHEASDYSDDINEISGGVQDEDYPVHFAGDQAPTPSPGTVNNCEGQCRPPLAKVNSTGKSAAVQATKESQPAAATATSVNENQKTQKAAAAEGKELEQPASITMEPEGDDRKTNPSKKKSRCHESSHKKKKVADDTGEGQKRASECPDHDTDSEDETNNVGSSEEDKESMEDSESSNSDSDASEDSYSEAETPWGNKKVRKTTDGVLTRQHAKSSFNEHAGDARRSMPTPETTKPVEEQCDAATAAPNGKRQAPVSTEGANMPAAALDASSSPPDHGLEHVTQRRSRRATSAPSEATCAKRRKLSAIPEMTSTASINPASNQNVTPSALHGPPTATTVALQPSTRSQERELSVSDGLSAQDDQRNLMIQKLPCLDPGGWLSSDVFPVLLSAFNPSPTTIWLPQFITVGMTFHRCKRTRIMSSHTMVLVPLSVDGNHWMLAWFKLQEKRVIEARLFDPYHDATRVRQCKGILWEFLVFHEAEVDGATLALDDYPFIQRNNYDCGIFVAVRAICLMNLQACPARTEGLELWRYAFAVLVRQQYNISEPELRPPLPKLPDHSSGIRESTFPYDPQDALSAVRRIREDAFQRRGRQRQEVMLLEQLAAACQTVQSCILSVIGRYTKARRKYAKGIEKLRRVLVDAGFDKARAQEATPNKLESTMASSHEQALTETNSIVVRAMQDYNEQVQRLNLSVRAQMDAEEALSHQWKADVIEERLWTS